MVVLIAATAFFVFGGSDEPLGPTQAANLSTSPTVTTTSTSTYSSLNSTLTVSVNSTAASNVTVTQTPSLTYNSTSLAPLEGATIMLDTSPGPQHALFYVAQNQSYYDEQQLRVQIEAGTGSASTVQDVSSAQVQFGYVDTSTAISAISAGADVQIVGVVTQTQPFAVFYLSTLGITSPQGLDGKTYCSSTADASHIMFPAFAATAGVNTSTINFVNVQQPYYSLLASGACQFTTGLLYDLSNYQAAVNATGSGAHVEYFLYSAYGIDPYGYSIIANGNLVKTNPGLVERFLNATYQGLQYVLKNQNTSLSYIASMLPDSSIAAQQPSFELFVNASMPLTMQSTYSANDPVTLGIVNATLLNQTASYTVKYLGAKPVAPSMLYTNSFLTCTGATCP